MHRRCIPAPAAAGGASLHRGCRVPAAVVRPCTGFLAPQERPASKAWKFTDTVAVRGSVQSAILVNLHRLPASRPLKARHTGWGGLARTTRFVLPVCADTLPVRQSPTVRRRSRDAGD